MDKTRKGVGPLRRTRRKPAGLRLAPLATESARPQEPPALPLEPECPGEPRWFGVLPAHLPLAVSVVNHGYLEAGLAIVVVGRSLGGSVLAGHFVVDLIARGVLEADGEVLGRDELEGYLDALDQRMPLASLSAASATAIILEGLRVGERHGIAAAEGLGFWQQVLEPLSEGAATPDPVFGPAGRPIAVAEVLARGTPEPEGGWYSDLREPKCVVRQAGVREH